MGLYKHCKTLLGELHIPDPLLAAVVMALVAVKELTVRERTPIGQTGREGAPWRRCRGKRQTALAKTTLTTAEKMSNIYEHMELTRWTRARLPSPLSTYLCADHITSVI